MSQIRFLVAVSNIQVLSSLLYLLIEGLRAFFVSRSAFGFFCGAAFGLEVNTPLSQQRSCVIETGWVPGFHARAPRLEKLDIISQNQYNVALAIPKKTISNHNSTEK
jgi:hypothetical protein